MSEANEQGQGSEQGRNGAWCSFHQCMMGECWEQHWGRQIVGLDAEQRRVVEEQAVRARHLALQAGVTQLWLERRQQEIDQQAEEELAAMDPEEVERLREAEEAEPF